MLDSPATPTAEEDAGPAAEIAGLEAELDALEAEGAGQERVVALCRRALEGFRLRTVASEQFRIGVLGALNRRELAVLQARHKYKQTEIRALEHQLAGTPPRPTGPAPTSTDEQLKAFSLGAC